MRPRTHTARRNLLTVAVVSLVGLGFILLSLALGGGLPGGSSYKVRAVLPSSSSLARKARVTVAGVQVGKVTKVTRQGVGAIVEMNITDDRVTPLPVDSRARLRMRTAVGENYLEIVPGHSRTTLAKDSVLSEARADDYVDVDKVLSMLRGRSREGARRLIQGLAAGVDGRGDQLNQVVDGGAGFLRDGSTLVNLLADDREQT
jgi:phospholipid/cholesterol/gamma-HCH transport system substrate-binding protein